MTSLKNLAVCLLTAWVFVAAARAQDRINTVVGGGPNNIPGTNANLNNPYEVAVDAGGNIYVAASGQNRVFKISPGGIITVVAGTGFAGYDGDNGPAARAELNSPYGVAVDHATPLPNVYIGDFSNCLVRKVNQNTGVITTIAGLVTVPAFGIPYGSCGYSGNGGAADKAELNGPSGVAVNPSTGDVYVAEYENGVVRKIAGGSPTGIISVVAGSGGIATNEENCQGSPPYGDGGKATLAYLCYPQAVTVDTSTTPPNLFISEFSRCDIQEVVGASGDIYHVAGSDTLGCGFTDKVIATDGQLNDPWQTHVSVSGPTTTVEVADFGNVRIRQFTLTYVAGVPKPGTITTIGGKGQGGFCSDTGSVLDACMSPIGIAYDSSGNWYIGDFGADRVRKVTKSTNEISTIAGWGANGGSNPDFSDPASLSGAGGTPALYYPVSVYADPHSSDVYVAGYKDEAVYVWNSLTDRISDLAGIGVSGFEGDGGPANSTATKLNYPAGVGMDSKGNVYIADQNNCAIREVVKATGDITTVAGGSPGALKGCGFSGDGGAAVNARFNTPSSLVFDSADNMYVTDYGNCAIRKIAAGTNIVSTIAGGPSLGCAYSGDGGPAVKARLYDPTGISVDGAGNIYFADQANNRIREIVAATGKIQSIAGFDLGGGYTGDGVATANDINSPGSTAADPNGNVFFADTTNQIVRWVTPTGTMITIAGTFPGVGRPNTGFSGDGGNALLAKFFEPTGITRDISGNFFVADQYNSRIRRVTPFSGYGLSTANLSFEDQPAGTRSNFQAVTVSAIGPTTISNVTASGGFSEIDDCVGAPLRVNQTCEIDVYFQPASAGNFNGELTISSNAFLALNPNSVALSGTGTGLKLTGSLAFGSKPLKNPTTLTATVTNSGTATTLKKIYLTETTDFSIKGGTCPVNGGALAAKASCTIVVSFSPQTAGAKKSTLVVMSSDPASPLLALATGSGA